MASDAKPIGVAYSADDPAHSLEGSPRPAVAPFDAVKALAFQEAWAKHLGVPVEFTDSIGMKFRLVPPGEFTMGMSREKAEMIAAESPDEYWRKMCLSSAPAHRVRLTQAQYVGTYEVTQEQYAKVTGVNPPNFPPKADERSRTSRRVLRGGNWYYPAVYCRSALRSAFNFDAGIPHVGLSRRR